MDTVGKTPAGTKPQSFHHSTAPGIMYNKNTTGMKEQAR